MPEIRAQKSPSAVGPAVQYPPQGPPRRTNTDIECLRCGAANIPENRICGNCGANLPIIYDQAGGVLKWQEDPYYGAVFKSEGARKMSPFKKGMLFRLGVIAFAILIALLILGRR